MKLIRNMMIGGLCLSSLHILWIILVGFGLAQPLMDFIFKLHMLNSPFQVQTFDPLLALGLVIITFSFGCFYGLVFYFVKVLLSK
jgi:hypothetical protein